jgi:DNA/RNA-binding domain of Phe-tRNA-synthetase-like protein
MRFLVTPDVFAAFPGMRVVAVLASRIDNTAHRPGLTSEWARVWADAGAAQAYGNSQSHPRVRPWRESFLRLGVSGKKFPSSIEALLRRALKGGAPFSINPLVDFYNAVSLRHTVPAGGFDVAALEGSLELRLTTEGDLFQALDEQAPSHVPVGEVAYTTGHTVLTRHFVWRQARRGLITKDTKAVLLVSEILGDFAEEVVDEVEADIVASLKSYFGVTGHARRLDVTTTDASW